MKRAGNLYPRIAEPQNLRLAYHKAARGKQDRAEVRAFRADFEENIRGLREGLLARKLNLGDYRFFYVHDPKKRLICAASFRERVLHHAVMNVCEETLEKYAVFDSYACRKGKGSHRAVIRARQFSRRFAWYLKLDIAKYFDSIDHRVLLAQLSRRFKDRDLLSLFDRIFKSYHTSPGKGVPIGNLVSQHMANFYLGSLDHWVKEDLRVKGYVRYMDDFVLWGRDRDSLKGLLKAIETRLQESLRLRLNAKIQLNRSARGLPFLGFRVYPGRVRLAPASGRRFVGKFRKYEHAYLEGEWSERTLSERMTSLVAFTRAASADSFRSSVIGRYGKIDVAA